MNGILWLKPFSMTWWPSVVKVSARNDDCSHSLPTWLMSSECNKKWDLVSSLLLLSHPGVKGDLDGRWNRRENGMEMESEIQGERRWKGYPDPSWRGYSCCTCKKKMRESMFWCFWHFHHDDDPDCDDYGFKVWKGGSLPFSVGRWEMLAAMLSLRDGSCTCVCRLQVFAILFPDIPSRFRTLKQGKRTRYTFSS